MRHRILAAIVLLNSALVLTMLVGFFTFLGRQPWFTWLFVAGTLLNAILFLVFYRHARRNARLSESQRNLWEILLFVASPVTYPVYVWRFIMARDHTA